MRGKSLWQCSLEVVVMHGLLSIASLVFALFWVEYPLDMYWEVGIETTPLSVTAYVDPTFVFWAESTPGSGFAFGNVIVMEDRLRNTEKGETILSHERIHVEQCRALGWWMWPASLVLPIEPPPVQGESVEERNEQMWVPPSWWQDRWHFISVRVGFG